MLKQRILTALVLLPLMWLMLFHTSNAVWAGFSGLMALLALWEYSRMCGIKGQQQVTYLSGTAFFMLTAYLGDWQLPAFIWALVLGFWFVVMPLWLNQKWRIQANLRGWIVGWILMIPFWFALMKLRPHATEALPLLALMALVWVADIFAYFTGRSLGKRPLAPNISPKKTWEGALGGTVAVLIYVVFAQSLGYLDWQISWLNTLMVAIALTAVSICGDLLESWLKRSAGIKDSSQLLPGHGGVFDRIDSLIAVLSVYTGGCVLLG